MQARPFSLVRLDSSRLSTFGRRICNPAALNALSHSSSAPPCQITMNECLLFSELHSSQTSFCVQGGAGNRKVPYRLLPIDISQSRDPNRSCRTRPLRHRTHLLHVVPDSTNAAESYPCTDGPAFPRPSSSASILDVAALSVAPDHAAGRGLVLAQRNVRPAVGPVDKHGARLHEHLARHLLA